MRELVCLGPMGEDWPPYGAKHFSIYPKHISIEQHFVLYFFRVERERREATCMVNKNMGYEEKDRPNFLGQLVELLAESIKI